MTTVFFSPSNACREKCMEKKAVDKADRGKEYHKIEALMY